jgi:PAS domain S-box-containing protein
LHDSSDSSVVTIESLDITEQKRLEEALKHEKDRAEQFLNIAEVILVTLDTKERIVLLNRKGYQVLGYKDGELIGADWIKTCIRPQDHEQVSEVFYRIMRGEIEPVEYFENYVLTKYGEERYIAWHNAVLRDNEGCITGTLSSGEDITERKQAEKALQASEEKYRAIIENASVGIFRTTFEGKLLQANPALTMMFGFASPDEMVANVTDLSSQIYAHSEDRESLKRLIIEHGSVDNFEAEVRKKMLNLSGYQLALRQYEIRMALSFILRELVPISLNVSKQKIN